MRKQRRQNRSEEASRPWRRSISLNSIDFNWCYLSVRREKLTNSFLMHGYFIRAKLSFFWCISILFKSLVYHLIRRHRCVETCCGIKFCSRNRALDEQWLSRSCPFRQFPMSSRKIVSRGNSLPDRALFRPLRFRHPSLCSVRQRASKWWPEK